ncbi:MAG: lasso RiPP family leader peptide-containing protein [Actinomycetota bacterium]|nr:lasso RiPP family leader peptide-containing protein [Actinomycetota bacterium]
MADASGRTYEPPKLVALGTIDDLTHGPPVFGGADLALFYRNF